METRNLIKAVITAVLIALSTNGNAQNRIIGGQSVDITERPFQAFIRAYHPNDTLQAEGGGVIINNEWLLTAAHVVEGYTANEISVTVGYTDVSFQRFINNHNVSQIIMHPNFERTSSGIKNDIALIKLTSPLVFSNTVLPINLTNISTYSNGTSAIVSGWGRINTTGNHDYEHLKKATVQISNVNNSIIKAYPSSNTPASGDSGGPLTIGMGTDIKLIGLVSSGNTAAPTQHETAYCNVGYEKSWIASQGVKTYSIYGPSQVSSTQTATFNYSAPGGYLSLSPNLEEISRTATTITVKGTGTGSGYINVYAGDKLMAKATMWVGIPIIWGISYDGRMLRVIAPSEAGIYYTEWNIGGMSYSTYDDFLYLSSSLSGWKTVTVRARNGCGYSSYYTQTINFDDGGGIMFIYDSSTSSININLSSETSTNSNSNQASDYMRYVIANAKSGIIVTSGTISSVGGSIDCSLLRAGMYTISITYNNKSISKTFAK